MTDNVAQRGPESDGSGMGKRRLGATRFKCLMLLTLGSMLIAFPGFSLPAMGRIAMTVGGRYSTQDKSATEENLATDADTEAAKELKKLGESFDKVARLKIRDRALLFDLQVSPEDGHQAIYQQLQNAGLQIYSSSWGGNQFFFEGQSKSIGFRFAKIPLEAGGRGRRDSPNAEIELEIEQYEPERRSLQLTAGKDSRLGILVRDDLNRQLFRFRQGSDGQASLLFLSPEQSVFVKAGNVDELLRGNPVLVNERFIPALSVFGLGNIVTPWSDSFRAAVRTAIMPWDESDRERVRSLIEGLDAGTFEARQAASTRLAERAKDERDLLLRIVQSIHFDPETRARVYSVVREHLSEAEKENVALVCQFLDKAEESYLREIMESENDEAARDAFGRYLASAGVRPSGTSSPSADGPTPGHEPARDDELILDSVKCAGPLGQHAGEISGILRLTWNGDQLALDRDHWKVPFGGKEIADLVADAKNHIENLNLPSDWFKPGGDFGIEFTGHSQILFDRLMQKIARSGEPSPSPDNATGLAYVHPRPYSGPSRNRYFNSHGVKASMIFGEALRRMNGRPTKSDSAAFEFSIHDRDGENTELIFEADNTGNLRVLLIADHGDCVAHLGMHKDRVLAEVIYLGKNRRLTGTNFRGLLEENRDFLAGQFFPLLARFGVGIDDSALQSPPVADASSR